MILANTSLKRVDVRKTSTALYSRSGSPPRWPHQRSSAQGFSAYDHKEIKNKRYSVVGRVHRSVTTHDIKEIRPISQVIPGHTIYAAALVHQQGVNIKRRRTGNVVQPDKTLLEESSADYEERISSEVVSRRASTQSPRISVGTHCSETLDSIDGSNECQYLSRKEGSEGSQRTLSKSSLSSDSHDSLVNPYPSIGQNPFTSTFPTVETQMRHSVLTLNEDASSVKSILLPKKRTSSVSNLSYNHKVSNPRSVSLNRKSDPGILSEIKQCLSSIHSLSVPLIKHTLLSPSVNGHSNHDYRSLRSSLASKSKQNGGKVCTLSASINTHLSCSPLISTRTCDSERSRIVLNISGQRFETFEKTLEIFPDTLLGDAKRRLKYYNCTVHEYILDRNYYIFNAILFYYQSKGILSKPVDIDRQSFIEELEFFDIKDCFDHRHVQEKAFVESKTACIHLPKGRIRGLIWGLMAMSPQDQVGWFVYVFSLFILIISVISYSAETFAGIAFLTGNSYEYSGFIQTLEVFFTIFFFLECMVRIWSAPKIGSYIRSGLGAVDIVSFLPVLIVLAVINFDAAEGNLAMLKVLMFLRVFRMLKFARYNDGFYVLLMTICHDKAFLCSTLLMIVASSFTFAGLIFYFEKLALSSENFGPDISEINGLTDTTFDSFFETVWFTLITQTTVGYGDIYPQTGPGKFFGSLCAISGAILFCIPIPVLVFRFVEYYYLQRLLKETDPEKIKNIMAIRESFQMG